MIYKLVVFNFHLIFLKLKLTTRNRKYLGYKQHTDYNFNTAAIANELGIQKIFLDYIMNSS